MKIIELFNHPNEGVTTLPSAERRRFLLLGLKVSGVFLGGSVLSLTSARNSAGSVLGTGVVGTFPYNSHYGMVVRQDACIGCKKCIEACTQANNVPAYGYRNAVLERRGSDEKQEFLPIFCNQCNRPPCVKVCPTKATYKDKNTGIVMMNNKLCTGCKACMASCPYNARYYHNGSQAVDKCDFCFKVRLNHNNTTTACVEACPTKALIFGNIADPENEASRLVHSSENTVLVLRPELGTMPHIFYLKG